MDTTLPPRPGVGTPPAGDLRRPAAAERLSPAEAVARMTGQQPPPEDDRQPPPDTLDNDEGMDAGADGAPADGEQDDGDAAPLFELDGKPVTKAEVDEWRQAATQRREAETQLAERRRGIEQHEQHVATARRVLDQTFDMHGQIMAHQRQALLAQVPAEPDPQMFATDPAGYLMQERQRRAAFERVQQLDGMLAQLNGAVAQAIQASGGADESAKQVRAQEEYGKLLGAIPAWRDQATIAREGPQVRDHLASLGFQGDALQDHRLFVLARQALLGGGKRARSGQTAPSLARAEARSVRTPTGRAAEVQRARQSLDSASGRKAREAAAVQVLVAQERAGLRSVAGGRR